MRLNAIKAQALIFAIFLLIIVGILATALLHMWESEVQIPSLQKYSLQAFYLAQAGIERAKIDILNNVNLAGGTGPNSYNSGGLYDLDPDYPAFVADPINNHLYDDGYVFRYEYTITDLSGGTDREIVGIGEVLEFIDNGPDGVEGTADDNVNILGHREIEVTIDGIADTVAPFDGADDVPGDNAVVSWSWHEI